MKYILLSIVTVLCVCQIGWSQKAVHSIQTADSLFAASAWIDAISVYESVLKSAPENALAWSRLGFSYHSLGKPNEALDSYTKSLGYKPSPQLENTVRSRISRIYSLKREKDKAFEQLDKALDLGYALVGELKNQKEFDNIRDDTRFKEAIKRADLNANPCMSNKQAREFDFWIGEWDVYPNGANVIVGHSKIEMASGGCMILENWTALGLMPNTGKSMNYVNAVTGKWEQYWIGSGGLNPNNPQKFVNGEYREGAMRFEFEQVTRQGQKQMGRFIFFNERPDQVRQFNEVSSDGGKTWTTVYDFIYKRKA